LTAAGEKHPVGLFVLFFTEMWERFSFYTVGGMFVLYVTNAEQGFGWPREQGTSVYSWYQMFVYLSPLFGGILADLKLGYRKSVMIGGFFFMAGHALLAVPSVPVMFAAMACLVIGNGFFKPNVSTMVGNLYPEGSHLKDRAYNIFYMGINVGALLAPITAEFMVRNFGFHPAFFMGAVGMVFSVVILSVFRRHVEAADRRPGLKAPVSTAATAVDAPPPGVSRQNPIDLVPDSRRIGALIVIFLVVIVFWMLFHQNQTTWTYFANDSIDWKVTGIISNAINPGWVILLTFPLITFWGWLDKRGKEPSTPTKMAIGMCLTGTAYFIMSFAGKAGGDLNEKVLSPWWLIGAYGVMTLGELMLSPMGLSLVSKVAPIRLRGIMMGGWFLATAIGNKLTGVGVYWDRMPHSTFFAMLGGLSLVMAVVLVLLLKPLKKAMPGV
jgi:proton-dependent oligopeptide transporter, POT family